MTNYHRRGGAGQRARDRIRAFLLVIPRAGLRGATGAWVAPLAIV